MPDRSDFNEFIRLKAFPDQAFWLNHRYLIRMVDLHFGKIHIAYHLGELVGYEESDEEPVADDSNLYFHVPMLNQYIRVNPKHVVKLIPE